MSNTTYSTIILYFENHTSKTIDRPSGFGVNEFGFFCVESNSVINMYPVETISAIEVFKSSLVSL